MLCDRVRAVSRDLGVLTWHKEENKEDDRCGGGLEIRPVN